MSTNQKQCARCGAPSPVLFRCQIDSNEGWVFCCESCLLTEKQHHPDTYRYGGTWKAKSGRRRKRR